MSVDTIDIDSGCSLDIEAWLKNETVGEYQRNLEERIMRVIFSEDITGVQFRKMVEELAWVGCDPENRFHLEREIVELNQSLDRAVHECGFLKKRWKDTRKVARFVADHKYEILLGAALCATGAGIVAATGYTASVAVGGIVVAGAGSVLASKDKPNPHIPRVAPPSSNIEIAVVQSPISSPLPQLELPDSVNGLLVTSKGVWLNGQFFPNTELMQHSHFADVFAKFEAEKGEVSQFASAPKIPDTKTDSPVVSEVVSNPTKCEGIETQTLNPVQGPQDVLKQPEVISRRFVIPGTTKPSTHIGWINGINNSFEESTASGAYIHKLAGGHAIAGIYNCSHTPLIDILEAGLLNHSGFSPITAKLLQNEWQAFHQDNIDRPNAKLLQLCHSQGAIHVRNALQGTPQEIRDRVMVVAIAPAAVVPKHLCFSSFNYVSEKDFVYKLEPAVVQIESVTIDDVIIPTFGEPIDYRDELIILKPHPDAKGIDHEVQSPTYLRILINRLEEYKRHEGEYLPEEKGNFE